VSHKQRSLRIVWAPPLAAALILAAAAPAGAASRADAGQAQKQ